MTFFRDLSDRLRNMTLLQKVVFFGLIWLFFFSVSQFRPPNPGAPEPQQIIVALFFFTLSWLMGTLYGLLAFYTVLLALWARISWETGILQNPLTILPTQMSFMAMLLIILLGRLGTSERRAYQAAKEAQEANSAKSRFLANMSHELRTPLAAITGYAELVEEQTKDPNIAKRMQKIISASSLLRVHVDSILDLAKLEAGKMTLTWQTVAIPDLLESILVSLRPLFDQQQNSFTLNVANSLSEVTTDAQKLSQILLNLLQNANKFTRGGTIELHIEQRPTHTTFQIKDSGIGMTKEQLGSVFLPFMQADMSTTREYGGTGLGLAIVKQLCDLLEGTIDVTSQLGVGSTFIVSIPNKKMEP